VLIQSRPELSKIWFGRHNDEAGLKAVRKEFTVGAIREAIGKSSAKLEKVFGELYDTSIDFGADPNERAFSSSALIEERNGLKFVSQIYLHDKNLMLKFGLKNTARVGVMLTELASFVVPERATEIVYPNQVAELLKHL
jgi:hypothetical protein